ncbi:MAG TPA: hypothetical protein VGS41_10200, partial [Chthonomonadales bacterium]|nr:hypothetical protein [Chthonomonadales bacterium]
EGRVSRYFTFRDGIFPPNDVRLSLVEASQHRIGTWVDNFILYCYHYDPVRGKYGLAIMNIVRLAGGLTVLMVGGSMALLMLWERRHKAAPADTAQS